MIFNGNGVDTSSKNIALVSLTFKTFTFLYNDLPGIWNDMMLGRS